MKLFIYLKINLVFKSPTQAHNGPAFVPQEGMLRLEVFGTIHFLSCIDCVLR